MTFAQLPLDLKLARFSFLLRKAYPFLGELSLMTERVYSFETHLAGVADNKLLLNKQRMTELGEPQFNFVILHELLHILFGHRYPAALPESGRKWANIAMDLTVNYALLKLRGELRAKSLPIEPLPDVIVPHVMDDLKKDLWPLIYTSFRQQLNRQGVGSGKEPLLVTLKHKRWRAVFPNYSLLSDIADAVNDAMGAAQNSDGDDSGNGEQPIDLEPDVLSSETSASTAEHKTMLAKAGRKAGTNGLPEFIKLAVERLLSDPVPYHIIFRKYLTGLAEKDDYCYSSPDRRFLHSDTIMPFHPLDTATELRKVVILLDVSSSICSDELKDFLGRMRSILSSFEFDGVVVTFSGDVCQDVKLGSLRSLDTFIAELRTGGGTNFGKAAEYVKTKYADYTCVAIFTDGEFLNADYGVKLPRSVYFLTADADVDAEDALRLMGKVIRLPETA